MQQANPHQGISDSPSAFGIDDVDAIFIVQSGHVDLYLTKRDSESCEHSRIHFARMEPGALVFGFDPATVPVGWDVSLLPSRHAQLEMVFEEDIRDKPEQIEAWILRLTEACVPMAEPHVLHPLAPGASLTITEKVYAICGTQPVVWLRHQQGSGLLFANPAAPVDGSSVFPMAQMAWIQEKRGHVVSVQSTEEVLGSHDWWPGITAFQGVLIKALVSRSEANATAAKMRLAQREAADAQMFDHSLRQMLLPMTSGGTPIARGTARDPLLRACEAIGKLQKLQFTAPGDAYTHSSAVDPVLALCRSSGIKYREVVLESKWYLSDGVPLLGFVASDARPVALLPNRGKGYQMYDPADDSVVPVSDDVAQTLKPQGQMFYRPFEPKPLKLRHLALFGLVGAWWDVAMAVGMALLMGLLGLMTPMISATVFDDVIPGADRARMLEVTVFLLTASVASILLGLSRDFGFLRIETKVDATVQAAIFDRLLSLPAQFFRRYTSGELAQRAFAIGDIRRLLTSSALSVLFSGFFSVFNLAYMLWLHPTLTVLAIALTAVTILSLLVVSVFYLRIQFSLVEKGALFAGLSLQLLSSMPKLRVAGAERRGFAKWMGLSTEISALGLQAERIGQRFALFNTLWGPLSLAAVYGLIGWLLMRTEGAGLTTGELLAFSSAYGAFSGAMVQMTQVGLGLLAAIPMYRSIKPILDATPEVDASKPSAPRLSGHIELSHVTFRYQPNTPIVLNKLSLVIEPGQFVAIVGPSGAGKSSVFRLLLGFEKPESGTVMFDGHDLSQFDVASVRQQMGVVLQGARLFRGEIFENIACGIPCSMDDAWEAARQAGLIEDLQAMPMGMKTIVGEDGAGLSGGQRQRLMIARAIVGKPKILLFDEATSALDNRTQAIVSRSLESLSVTRVVIAHRLSTIVKADRIFVIDGGNVVQAGTYEELMQQPGLFAELAKRQLA
jgi:ATP-binding cassette subfamily C protein